MARRRAGRGMARTGWIAVALATALMGCAEREIVLTGERLDLRADLSSEAAADSAPPPPLSLAAPVNVAEWTHKALNPLHAQPHLAFAAMPSLRWTASVGTGEGRKHRISADPVVAGGRIFTVDSRALVSAVSTAGGTLWARDLTPAGDSSDDASGAGLAADGGRLYVGTGFGDLWALDAATGAVIWRQELDAAVSGAPTVVDDLVYVVTRDGTAWAVETDDGRIRWTLAGTDDAAGVVGGAAPAVTERLAILPFSSGEIVAALRQGGTQVWKTNVVGERLGKVYAAFGDIAGDPVVSGDRIFAGNPSGRINAVDLATGAQLWSTRDGAMSPVVVAGGSVFAVTDLAELIRLDAATGERLWGRELPFFEKARIRRRKDVFAHYGPVLAGGRLWVASTDDTLRAFDPATGALLATVPLPGGATTNPVVVGGTMYLVNTKAQLLAFR
ncbi:quinoprotein [Rhodobacteraceae bacterium CCMM004]|nr:quinoprotein [Rhodobacteraceae bacterium CCMM004]